MCDDDWDFADARVACREAGCGPALGATGLGHFGYGRGPVLLDNVGCMGTEARLSDCFHLGWGQHNCGHHEDAGALCAGKAAGAWPAGKRAPRRGRGRGCAQARRAPRAARGRESAAPQWGRGLASTRTTAWGGAGWCLSDGRGRTYVRCGVGRA